MKLRNKLTTFLVFLIFMSLLVNCEAEKEKDFYGLGEEDLSLFLSGLVLNRGFVDTRDGNIVDQANSVVYKKCVAGQEYRAAENDCKGVQRGSFFTPNDTVLYGASKYAYCSINSWSCNSSAFPFPLVANADVAFPGTSEAYNFCNQFNQSNGFPGWRVANPNELKRLTLGGRNAMLQVFPDTPEDWFWSEWGKSDDVQGETALAVSFERSNFGEEKGFLKRERYYVRCARPLTPQDSR